MALVHKAMHTKLERLARIPQRCRRDVEVIRLLRNWTEALSAECTGRALSRLQFRNGVVLNAPPTIDLAFLFHEIWVGRTYTPRRYEISRGDVIIDVGANIGVFATYAASRAPDVKVYSYEPFPENVTWLRRNINESELANVRVHDEAVAGSSGARVLQVNASDWMFHALSAGQTDCHGVQVRCVTLDGILGANNITQCDLLKLDCEGSEYEVIQGCSADTLRRIRRIVAEYHEGPAHAGTGRELCRFLESRSFRVDSFTQTGVGCGYLSARSARNER